MAGLIDLEGNPLGGKDTTKRREMKSGQIKKTPYGDMIFKLVVDVPKAMPEDDFQKNMREYGAILNEAFRGKR